MIRYEDLSRDDAFNLMIGRMDEMLSLTLLTSSDSALSEIQIKTLEHHAEDLIGAGNKILENLSARKAKNA